MNEARAVAGTVVGRVGAGSRVLYISTFDFAEDEIPEMW